MQKAQTPPIAWLKSIPFFLAHLVALGIFFVPFQWKWVGLAVGLYYLRMFGITAGYHRYFAHRGYKTNRVFQFLIALIGTMSAQKGVLWWAANHRLHHRFSDTKNDIHSPVQNGFWWAHVGWILSEGYDETRWDQIQDLAGYPELRWLNRHYLIPPMLLALTLLAFGGWTAMFWGFASTVALWHGTFCINSLAHVFGTRRYTTTDDSRNNFWLSLATLGEGWHNNHHCYMSSARQGFFWWEIDVSYYALKALSWVGVTRDLRQPPLALLENKRIRPRASSLHAQRPSPLPGRQPSPAAHP